MKKFVSVVAVVSLLCVFSARAWEPLPAISSGYYQVLLHLGANFNTEYLYSSGGAALDVDQLAVFGGETQQAPYPGLVYNGLTGPGVGQTCNLAWTVTTNTAANGLWATAPNKDNYIKYWHIYVRNPTEENRSVKIYYRVDDGLYIWRNGTRIVSMTSNDGGTERNVAAMLLPGTNSLTIKLREGTVNDWMGFRICNTDGSAITDLEYSFYNRVLVGSARPIEVLKTYDSVSVDPNFVNHTGELFDLYVVCDSVDRGGVLADWLDSPTCCFQEAAALSAPPALVTVGGLPEYSTTYAARLFVVHAGGETESVSFSVSTSGREPGILTLPATSVDNLSATANGNLFTSGPAPEGTEVRFYWGTQDGGEDPEAWEHLVELPVSALGLVEVPLEGLWYNTTYYYRFAAENSFGTSWSSESVEFTTLGLPIFDVPSARIISAEGLLMSVGILSPGAGTATAECLWGTSPDELSVVRTWDSLEGVSELAYTQTVFNVEAPNSYYAFRIHGVVDEDTQWTVSTPTNLFATTGTNTWTAGGGENTDWYNPANWDKGVPGPFAMALFPVAEIAVTATEDITVGNVLVRAGNGSVAFDFGTSTLNVSSNFVAGAGHTGVLTLSGKINAGLFMVSTNTSANTVTLTAGSSLSAGRLIVGFGSKVGSGDNNRLTVSPGALLTVTGSTTISQRYEDYSTRNNELLIQGLFLANGIGLGPTSGSGGNATGLLTIDGGVTTNQGTLVLSQTAGTGHTVTLRNEAVLQQNGKVTIGQRATLCCMMVTEGSVANVVGDINMYDYGDNPGNSGRLIVSNATLAVTGKLTSGYKNTGHSNQILIFEDPGQTTTVSFGGSVGLGRTAPNNKLVLDGGSFTATALTMATDSTTTSTNNQVIVAGATAKLSVTNLTLRGQGVLRFDIPDSGFAQTPVALTGGAIANLAADTRVEINASGFIGKARLLQANTISALPDENFVVTLPADMIYRLTRTDQIIEINIRKKPTALLLQ